MAVPLIRLLLLFLLFFLHYRLLNDPRGVPD